MVKLTSLRVLGVLVKPLDMRNAWGGVLIKLYTDWLPRPQWESIQAMKGGKANG